MSDVDSNASISPRLERVLRACDVPMGLLALAVVPAIVLEDRATDPLLRSIANGVNWFVWLAFCGEFVAGLVLARERLRFVRRNWFDLAIILLSPPFLVPQELEGLRALRVVRLLRLVRLLRAFGVALIGLRLSSRLLKHHRFHYVALVGAAAVLVGSFAIYALEHGINRSIDTVGDALWWAAVTATTVGYGDVAPITWEGRVVAVLLILVGIAVVGVFTATVASFILEQGKKEEVERLEKRLADIEAKLDRLLSARRTL
jgi:voltage-gated potassium channel